MNASAFGAGKQGLGQLTPLLLVAGWVPQEIDSEMEIRQQVLIRKCFGVNTYGWDGKEAGLRRWKIPGKFSADPNRSFRIGSPFRFVQNWVEGINEAFLYLRH